MFNTQYTAGGRLDAPHYPTFTVPFMTGMKETAPEIGGLVTLEYEVPFDGELYSISIDASRYINDDNWDLYVDDVLLCDKIYVKRAPEGVNLMSFVPVSIGSKVRVDFRSMKELKDIWCTLHFLKEGEFNTPGQVPDTVIKVTVPVIRVYIMDTGAEDGDKFNLYLNGAKIIDGFTILNDAGGTGVSGVNYIEIPLNPGNNTIEFEGVSPGEVGYLTAAFRVTDQQGTIIYDTPDLPNIEMADENVDGNRNYIAPLPRVAWVVNRT